MMFSRAFCCRRFGLQYCSWKRQDESRSVNSAARDAAVRLFQSAANGPMMDWNESSDFSIDWQAACARCVYRAIKENPATTNVSGLDSTRCGVSGGYFGKGVISSGKRLPPVNRRGNKGVMEWPLLTLLADMGFDCTVDQ